MVEQFDSMGVRDHFPICRNFVWEFSLEFFVGFFVLLYFGIFLLEFLCYYTLVFLFGTSCGWGFYMVPLAYDNGMGPRYWERESRH